MSKFEIPLLESRLKKLIRTRRKYQAVLDERSDEYFEIIKKFNTSRDIQEKNQLALKAQMLLVRMKTWTSRCDIACKRLVELDEESRELSHRLYLLKSRAQYHG